MAATLYLGIDGGGTTSRARLADEAGRVLGEGVAGSSNLTLGIDVAVGSILQATARALAAAGLGDGDQRRIHAGFGLAGANIPSLEAAFNASPLPFAGFALASDAVTACLGAHGGKDGAILIIGTGTQGLALVGGTVTTIGGWGFAVSDEGSGAILGRAAIRAAVLSADGLGPSSPLTEAMMLRFSGRPSEALEWSQKATPRDYGGFAPLVFEHQAAGDPVAARLLADSVGAIAGMLDRLAALGARRIALMGGLAAPHRPHLPPRFDTVLVEPEGDAMDGALALARRGGLP